jgi:hypothetical protein
VEIGANRRKLESIMTYADENNELINYDAHWEWIIPRLVHGALCLA